MASDRNRTLWMLAGLTAGVVTGLWLWRRGTERESEEGRPGAGTAASRIADTLARDPELAGRGLRVDGIGEGIVELSGTVSDRDQRERAVALAHGTPGVHTVVNRLVLEPEESRLEENRARHEAEGPALHHDGMGVGMGTRRQSPDTDPDRPSDRQKLVDRELEPERFEAEVDTGSPEPAGPGEPVEGAEPGEAAGEGGGETGGGTGEAQEVRERTEE